MFLKVTLLKYYVINTAQKIHILLHFRLTPVKVEEFIRYCNLRRKHSIIDTLEFDKTLEDINKKGEQPISFLIARQNWTKNQNQVSTYKKIVGHPSHSTSDPLPVNFRFTLAP